MIVSPAAFAVLSAAALAPHAALALPSGDFFEAAGGVPSLPGLLPPTEDVRDAADLRALRIARGRVPSPEEDFQVFGFAVPPPHAVLWETPSSDGAEASDAGSFLQYLKTRIGVHFRIAREILRTAAEKIGSNEDAEMMAHAAYRSALSVLPPAYAKVSLPRVPADRDLRDWLVSLGDVMTDALGALLRRAPPGSLARNAMAWSACVKLLNDVVDDLGGALFDAGGEMEKTWQISGFAVHSSALREILEISSIVDMTISLWARRLEWRNYLDLRVVSLKLKMLSNAERAFNYDDSFENTAWKNILFGSPRKRRKIGNAPLRPRP
ncbi:MAG: hypothetical protein BJ554DRAFT_2455 [Olpidium bornovanus]|uniref:Uncharacterized protein n=1 Tax=Olpidium bornovanus TaxID=278681 RepID=A0A8H8DGE7_9FUNG|nr:MAG: hypothetical protein BJ554DRAFT_2455 [Olpidium bornovanus]